MIRGLYDWTLRLADHPALTAAAETGRPVIPVFIHDEVVDTYGAAPKWRLGLAVEEFARSLEALDHRLICRRGPALDTLQDLIKETGATAVYWSRAYDPASIKRDTGVKAALIAKGCTAHSLTGHLLFEPWRVQTGSGGHYKVYSPFWRAVRDMPVPTSASARPSVVRRIRSSGQLAR